MARVRRGVWIGGASVLLGWAWSAVGVAGNLDFLLKISDSAVLQWIVKNPDTCLVAFGVLLLALNLGRQPLDTLSRTYDHLYRRFKTRRWTDAGLNWAILPESHKQLRDERMLAILSISPVPDSELPQPLDIVIKCAGRIAEVSANGHVEIEPPHENEARLRLCAPKLLPPARLDVTLVSAGNTEVRVVEVRRAPRKGVAPTRPKPPTDPAPPTASGQAPPSSRESSG